MSNAPTLINLPPPPSDPMTPSDMGPGTPNSGTTTMSELSTVAIKDGHRGHLPHHHHNPFDAERADRISRLAGLERISAARQNSNQSITGSTSAQPPTAYFDQNNNPQIVRERSTVGSASATGSVGGRTTWASASDTYEDKMSEDQDMEEASSTGFSDEASLVGFGEGARTPARQQSGYGSPIGSVVPVHLRDQPVNLGGSPLAHSTESQIDAKMKDGMTYDDREDFIDTAGRTPPAESGAETSVRIMKERNDESARLAEGR
ncbi:hypothetical protein M501DRAFT_1011376 [Patellaria atrata CBS 101060]|uniref:Uncharacterized protein n=1 Tax=Patellaria atrata CBS 101060 TaxID=1346257 RepID=A0A9P4S9H2_9PEZI|nr:hypothetical protein M501DRAFT_1011376 [Patellaria atrata CBS 101060]